VVFHKKAQDIVAHPPILPKTAFRRQDPNLTKFGSIPQPTAPSATAIDAPMDAPESATVARASKIHIRRSNPNAPANPPPSPGATLVACVPSVSRPAPKLQHFQPMRVSDCRGFSRLRSRARDALPAATGIQSILFWPNLLVEIEAIAAFP
jgi:hypothetical protein